MTALARTFSLAAIAVFALATTACNEEEPVPFTDTGADATDSSSDAADVGDDTQPDAELDTPPDTATCVEGAVRDADDGCNTCTCTGGAWACTEMACPEPECVTDADCIESGCSGQLCAAVPLDSDCEWRPEYACYDDAYTHCGCLEGTCGWDPTPELEACLGDPPCLVGETRPADDGCNTCTCNEDGGWVCTEIACPDPECEPGTLGGECDQCVCDDDGTWVCADVECPEPECEPGETRELDDCNTCTCLDSGTWACTGLACPDCEPGAERPADDGCNTCTCTDDGTWACTEMACLDCEPGAERPADDGCNTCTCTDDGTWACTEIACGTECNSDDECIVSGCSGQICVPEPMATTCEWLPEYACYREPTTTCGCNAGWCGWDPTEALATCLADAGGM